MKNKSAFKTAKLMALNGYWDIATLYPRKAYGK